MKRIPAYLAAIGTMTAAAVGATPLHQPLHLPTPILQHPVAAAPAPLRHLTKVISASACALVNGFTWNGPGVSVAYGAVAPQGGDYLVNPNAPSMGPTTSSTPPDTVVLFCDARLPAEAVAFDYAELEYAAPSVAGNSGPTLAAFLDARAPSVNGYAYDQTMPLSSCTGAVSPPYAGASAISLCATDGGQSFEADAGIPGLWPGAGWTLFAVHFVITVPPSPDANQPNLVYRVIVHYEAP